MSQNPSKKATSYLQATGHELKTLFAKVKELRRLNEKVMAYIDPALGAYCQVANFSAGRLTIIAANGSIATQLRFQTLDLLRRFKQDPSLQFIREIQYKVQSTSPHLPSPRSAKKSMAALSPETAGIVSMMAESITDPKLREVMDRIAKRVKK